MLGSIWPFLKDPANLAVLGSIGAGITAIAGGAWALFTFFIKKSEKSGSTTTVKADHGSVAAGGDINAPVTVGLDEKEVGQELRKAQQPLRDEFERLAAQVAREKGVEVAPLRAVLVKLGEAGVKDEDIPKRLDEKADELIKLRAKVDALQQGSPGLAAIAQEAQALIDKGDLDGASRALAARREASRTRRIDASREDAEILALEARVEDLQLAYRTAAEKYAEAAALIAPFDRRIGPRSATGHGYFASMAWTAARKRRGGSAILSKPSAMTLAASITFQKAKSSLPGGRGTLGRPPFFFPPASSLPLTRA